ncbi:MAG: hypothetical protein ACMXYK_00380 [Candidatus Woesearchaeota archaeon]
MSTILVSIVSYTHASRHEVWGFLLQNHLVIMIVNMIVLILFGFFWASHVYKQISVEKKNTKDIFDIVLQFLSSEEKLVLEHLVSNNFESTQAKIAHLEKMGAVKALRTVQKMEEKRLVTIHKEGKLRRIVLEENIRQLLE